jgi:hypothetical protein
MATAPQAIYSVFDDIQAAIPSANLGGIVGDVAHSFGYHLARNELPSTDYSVQYALDHEGDPGSASALDVDLGPELMITVTNRLLRAAQERDPRLAGVREFCGTTDGYNTHPFDLATRQDGPLNSWDSSHLWHVHISFYRAYSENYDAIKGVASVIAGGESTQTAIATPLKPSTTATEDQDMAQQTLYRVVKAPKLGYEYLASPTTKAVWVSDTDLKTEIAFGHVANPTKPVGVVQVQIDNHNRFIAKGA